MRHMPGSQGRRERASVYERQHASILRNFTEDVVLSVTRAAEIGNSRDWRLCTSVCLRAR